MMTCPSPPSIVDVSCTLVQHECWMPGLYWMQLQVTSHAEGQYPSMGEPGQFFMVQWPQTGFLFRRPFSLLRYNRTRGLAELVYKVVGHGTQQMSALPVGSSLQLLGPLGNAFAPLASPQHTLLLAGGIGLAPLAFQAEHWRRAGQALTASPWLVFGARTRAEVQPYLEGLQASIGDQRLALATDDGTLGTRGTVLSVLEQWPQAQLEAVQQVLVCGPNRMMAACVRYLAQRLPGVPVQVSLENHMPCGTGACYGCVVGMAQGAPPVRVCQQGPVFLAEALAWTEHGPDEWSWASAAPGGCGR